MMLHAQRLRLPLSAARVVAVESDDPFSFDERGELVVALPDYHRRRGGDDPPSN